MSGKFVNNNAKNLIIVFQSAGRVPANAIKAYLKNEISDQDIEDLHSKYNYFGLSKKELKADYYFIKDHYSGIYGWYISDFGKNIIEDIQREIKKIVMQKNYKVVITFGSSKGGSGALLHGLLSPYVNNIFALVPQINVTRYVSMHLPIIKPLLLPNKINEDNMKDIFNFIDFSKISRKKHVFLYTGIFDEQFGELNSFAKSLPSDLVSITRLINVERKKHSPIVNDNLDFIYQIINKILVNRRTVDDNLFRIDSKLFIYLGKKNAKEKI